MGGIYFGPRRRHKMEKYDTDVLLGETAYAYAGQAGREDPDEASPPIYLDYNATTPIAVEVARAMIPCMTRVWGNPSSGHFYGKRAKAVVEAARKDVARAIGAQMQGEITFTSGGTESANHAIKSAVARARAMGFKNPIHVVTSSIEHPCVSEVARHLESPAGGGVQVTYVDVDSEGRVSSKDVLDAIIPPKNAL